jgi:hypothetical protein
VISGQIIMPVSRPAARRPSHRARPRRPASDRGHPGASRGRHRVAFCTTAPLVVVGPPPLAAASVVLVAGVVRVFSSARPGSTSAATTTSKVRSCGEASSILRTVSSVIFSPTTSWLIQRRHDGDRHRVGAYPPDPAVWGMSDALLPRRSGLVPCSAPERPGAILLVDYSPPGSLMPRSFAHSRGS